MTSSMPLPLTRSALARLPASVARPLYDPATLRAGIVHIGVGNFHRAHQAVYLDDLFNLGHDHDWAIVGAGVMEFDAARRDTLKAQDWLSTVVELSPGRLNARVTGSMIDFCPIDPAALIARIADPAIRIVSLTITEGGYYMDAAGGFDAHHPDMVHDAAFPEAPRSVFGLILAGLRLRAEQGNAAPTILSCDNLPENGHVTRAALEGLARQISGPLGDWVAANVSFPNSMVDRITPATSAHKREMVAREFGIADAEPVVCEPFRQWVMEDRFPLGRPALERVGVQFVTDVTPYETMKLRILNAGHAAIAYPAALLGHDCVHEAMADPDIARWLRQLMLAEVIPVLEPIPGEDYPAYLETCANRFANPEVRDTIARLCQDGSNRQPKFILPTITEALAAGRPVEFLALELAFWCQFCAEAPALDDPRAETLARAARLARTDPPAFLRIPEVFGALAENRALVQSFTRHLTRLQQEGVRTVLRGLSSEEAA